MLTSSVPSFTEDKVNVRLIKLPAKNVLIKEHSPALSVRELGGINDVPSWVFRDWI
jgi:hypothetical protein